MGHHSVSRNFRRKKNQRKALFRSLYNSHEGRGWPTSESGAVKAGKKEARPRDFKARNERGDSQIEKTAEK